MSQRHCLRCQGEMDQGYMLDRTDNARYSGHWVEGTPTRRFLGGIKAAPSFPVLAYRCKQCYTLELVAPDPDHVESGQLSLSDARAGKGALSED